MKTIRTTLLNKPIRIDIAPRAETALARRASPLRVEMELYFSCLIGKAVRFDEATQGTHFEAAGPWLQIGFHAVQTHACSIASLTTPKPGRDAFPIVRPERFVPKWLALDFRDGCWLGTFGLTEREVERHAA